MNTTNLGYKGIVKFKLKIGGKIFNLTSFNNGTDYLKKSFCKFLTGNYGGNPDTPQLLDLRKFDTDANKWITCLNQEIVLTGKTYLQTTDEALGINNNWVARFTAAIPFASLIEKILDSDTHQYRFYLYGSFDESDISERYHDLAYVNVTAESLSQITEGTQALLEWSMQLLNYDEVGSSSTQIQEPSS